MSLISAFQNLGFFLDRRLRKMLKNDTYFVDGSALVRQRGFFARQTLPIASIQSWTLHQEMVFDIVEIELTDNVVVRWIDDDGSLVMLLEQHAGACRATAG